MKSRFLAFILALFILSTTAFAYMEPKAEQSPYALTPDGNITLVDDIGTTKGKQFITMVTKTGNYFYIIIDRDDEGKETVHFLNQVDELDLMALMDEDTLENLEKEEEKTPIIEPEPEPEPKPIEEPQEPEKEVNSTPIIMLILLLVGGIAAFVFLKFNGKKQAEQVKPDPDADYIEDEEYDFPEDDEYEEYNEPVN